MKSMKKTHTRNFNKISIMQLNNNVCKTFSNINDDKIKILKKISSDLLENFTVVNSIE